MSSSNRVKHCFKYGRTLCTYILIKTLKKILFRCDLNHRRTAELMSLKAAINQVCLVTDFLIKMDGALAQFFFLFFGNFFTQFLRLCKYQGDPSEVRPFGFLLQT